MCVCIYHTNPSTYTMVYIVSYNLTDTLCIEKIKPKKNIIRIRSHSMLSLLLVACSHICASLSVCMCVSMYVYGNNTKCKNLTHLLCRHKCERVYIWDADCFLWWCHFIHKTFQNDAHLPMLCVFMYSENPCGRKLTEATRREKNKKKNQLRLKEGECIPSIHRQCIAHTYITHFVEIKRSLRIQIAKIKSSSHCHLYSIKSSAIGKTYTFYALILSLFLPLSLSYSISIYICV